MLTTYHATTTPIIKQNYNIPFNITTKKMATQKPRTPTAREGKGAHTN